MHARYAPHHRQNHHPNHRERFLKKHRHLEFLQRGVGMEMCQQISAGRISLCVCMGGGGMHTRDARVMSRDLFYLSLSA